MVQTALQALQQMDIALCKSFVVVDHIFHVVFVFYLRFGFHFQSIHEFFVANFVQQNVDKSYFVFCFGTLPKRGEDVFVDDGDRGGRGFGGGGVWRALCASCGESIVVRGYRSETIVGACFGHTQKG